MVSFPRPGDHGYATPAALVLSLALAMTATALAGRSVAVMRLARADLERAQAEHALDGAHLAAAAEVVRSGAPPPYYWTFTTELGWAEAVAEPEDVKLGLAAASALDDAALDHFGVVDKARLRARLAEAAAAGAGDVSDLDPSATWRACAMRMISPYGQAQAFAYRPGGEPGPGPDPASWRIGEAWRIRVTATTGWRDDRIVRFTGDARRPAAVVTRRVSRGEGDGGRCDAVLKAVADG